MKDVFIISGTTSGLGLSFAKMLIEEGKEVYSISRMRNKRNSFIPEENHFSCDLSLAFEVKKTMARIMRSIDFESIRSITLINNAGMIKPIGSVGTNSLELVNQNINVNLVAPIAMAEIFTCAVQDLPTKKYILNISSGAARKPYAGWSSYCASKSGLDMFTRCMGEEQKEQVNPIKILAIAPGVIDTKMQDEIREVPEEQFKMVNRFIELKEDEKLLAPDFVADKLVELLFSDKTSTGGCYDIRDFIDEKQGK